MVNWTEIHPDFTEKEIKEWENRGFDYEDAKWWIKKQIHPSEVNLVSYLHWRRLDVQEEEWKLEQLREEYSQANWQDWTNIHKGFRYCQQEWEEWGFTYSEAKEWIVNKFTPWQLKEITNWKDCNFTAKTSGEWIEAGFQPWEYGLVADLKNQGYTHEHFLENFSKERKAQKWIDFFYPRAKRKEIEELDISEKNLTGTLDLTDFHNLEELYCHGNNLTKIDFSNNSPSKLKILQIAKNNFSEKNLSFLSEFENLKVLNVSENNFSGSLKHLEKLTNLRSLDISDTDISDGLNYLSSEKLESLFCRIENKTDAKCFRISEILESYHLGYDNYDFKAWKEEFLLKKDGKNSWERGKIKNILLIGWTGGGKSTLANVLSNSNEFEEGESFASTTNQAKCKVIKVKSGKGEEIEYRIIDTVGLGDTERSSNDKIKKLEKLLKKFSEKGKETGSKSVEDYIYEGISQIFLVISEKLTDNIIEEYLLISDFLFDKEVFKHITIVKTKFPNFENENCCKETTESLISLLNEKKNEINKKIIEKIIEKGRIIYVDNPLQLKIVDEKKMSEREIAKNKSNIEDRKRSREKIFNYLEEIISNEVYKPMNGQKLKEEFDKIKSGIPLDKWLSATSEENKELLRKFFKKCKKEEVELFCQSREKVDIRIINKENNFSLEEIKKELDICKKELKKDCIISESGINKFLEKFGEFARLEREIEAGNWVIKVIEKEKEKLEELKDWKKRKDQEKAIIDTLLYYQKNFTRKKEEGDIDKIINEQLKNAKINSEEKIGKELTKNLVNQQEMITKLELRAKVLETQKRFIIQVEIKNYLELKKEPKSIILENFNGNIKKKKTNFKFNLETFSETNLQKEEDNSSKRLLVNKPKVTVLSQPTRVKGQSIKIIETITEVPRKNNIQIKKTFVEDEKKPTKPSTPYQKKVVRKIKSVQEIKPQQSQVQSFNDSHWVNLHRSFTSQTLINQWKSHNFSHEQVQDWKNAFVDDFNPAEVDFFVWLRDIKQLTPQECLNYHNINQLKREYQTQLSQTQIEVPPKTK